MSCCIELVQVATTAPVVESPGPAPVIRLRSVTVAITGQARAAVIVPDITIAVIGGQASSGGGTGGGGNLNEVFKVVFINTGDVALRGDGTIVTARV